MKKEDEIDSLAGIILNKKIGDKVEEGEALSYIHTNKENVEKEIEILKSAYEISENVPNEYKHILGII